MRLLDLFCGAGGAAMGYYRAFGGDTEIVGVDIAPQKRYPFEFVQADVFEFMESGEGDGFDFYHASPPCQRWSAITKLASRKRHLDLLAPVRERLEQTGKPYVIENVPGAPLVNPLTLCGTMFGLGVIRHRLFESLALLLSPGPCCHQGTVADGTYSGVHGGGPRTTHNIPYSEQRRRWEHDMGIHWMQTRNELAQAIPPAYTEWIGQQMGVGICQPAS